VRSLLDLKCSPKGSIICAGHDHEPHNIARPIISSLEISPCPAVIAEGQTWMTGVRGTCSEPNDESSHVQSFQLSHQCRTTSVESQNLYHACMRVSKRPTASHPSQRIGQVSKQVQNWPAQVLINLIRSVGRHCEASNRLTSSNNGHFGLASALGKWVNIQD
jgi:hypothetical protein